MQQYLDAAFLGTETEWIVWLLVVSLNFFQGHNYLLRHNWLQEPSYQEFMHFLKWFGSKKEREKKPMHFHYVNGNLVYFIKNAEEPKDDILLSSNR